MVVLTGDKERGVIGPVVGPEVEGVQHHVVTRGVAQGLGVAVGRDEAQALGEALGQAGLQPAWSPDGKQITFFGWSSDDEWIHIFVMNADGSDIHQVTSGTFNDAYMTWAPDGTILFMRSTPPVNLAEVFAIKPDGSGLAKVTENELVRGFALSPDGKRLAVFKGATFQIVVHPTEATGNELLLLDAFSVCDDV